jgi:hypothetical protein
MPAHWNITYAVNNFEYTVRIAENIDASDRDPLIADAFRMCSQILDEVIERLDDPKYQEQFRTYSHAAISTVFESEETRQRFIETEEILLRLSGWHDNQIEKVIEAIPSSLILLQSPPDFHQLTQDLREVRDEMAQISEALLKQKERTDQYIEWLKGPGVILFGGLALILVDGIAETIIPNPFVQASTGIGGGLVSNVITDLRTIHHEK